MSNFLPEFIVPETRHRNQNTLSCLKRAKHVPATPEERVRQRILNWLMNVRQWPSKNIEVERNYTLVGDPIRQRIRSDVELLNDTGDTIVVIECKAPHIPLGTFAEKQAKEYAHKSKAKYIWLSNGESHKFLTRNVQRHSTVWEETSELVPLNVINNMQITKFAFPEIINNRSVKNYFEKYFTDNQFADLSQSDQKYVLAIHKLLYDTDMKLPFSHNGVHILENRGLNYHSFTNASGGQWHNLYADFIGATTGRVEALSLAISDSWDGSIRLCIGVRKPKRTHLALEMSFKDCSWQDNKRYSSIYHDGRMSAIKTETVFDAVSEAGVDNWIREYDGKKYLYLGNLYQSNSVSWGNSKNLLANLLHYGLIRTNLRDANSIRKSKVSS